MERTAIINEDLDAIRHHIRELQGLVAHQGLGYPRELQALVFKFYALKNQEGSDRGEAVERLMKETGSLLLAFRRRGKRKRDEDEKETKKKKRQKRLPRDQPTSLRSLGDMPDELTLLLAKNLDPKSQIMLKRINKSTHANLTVTQPPGPHVGDELKFNILPTDQCPNYSRPGDTASCTLHFHPYAGSISSADMVNILEDLKWRGLTDDQWHQVGEMLSMGNSLGDLSIIRALPLVPSISTAIFDHWENTHITLWGMENTFSYVLESIIPAYLQADMLTLDDVSSDRSVIAEFRSILEKRKARKLGVTDVKVTVEYGDTDEVFSIVTINYHQYGLRHRRQVKVRNESYDDTGNFHDDHHEYGQLLDQLFGLDYE